MCNRTQNALVRIVFAVVCVASLGGCAAPQPAGEEPAISISAAELITKHNNRAATLSQLNARGVIELRWTDDDGRHFEQGDVELWVDQPNRTAMRVDKLGEVFIWLGSDDQWWWLFDLASEPATLYTAPLESAFRSDQLNVASVHPLALLDLLGMTRVNVIEGESVQRDSDELKLSVRGRRSDLQLGFDPKTLALRGVAVLDDAGESIAVSRLRDPGRVRLPGVNELNWPRMYTQVNITLVAVDGSVLLALNRDMSAVIESDLADRIFDRETLTRALQPVRIQSVDDTPSAAIAD